MDSESHPNVNEKTSVVTQNTNVETKFDSVAAHVASWLLCVVTYWTPRQGATPSVPGPAWRGRPEMTHGNHVG
jgi:hypothetical protein